MKTPGIASNSIKKLQRKTVNVAGFMFLFAFIVPTLNWTFLLSKLHVTNNVIATANNIVANELLFRIGITVELFMSFGLLVLGLALYQILNPVNKPVALLALFLKIIEAALSATLVLFSFLSLQIIIESDQLTAFASEQLQALVGFLLGQHTALYAIPMVFLGLDMMLFTYLFLKSNFIPRLLAIFGILSFMLIFIHALLFIIKPEWATVPIVQIIFWVPSGLFELVIGSWLLIKGVESKICQKLKK